MKHYGDVSKINGADEELANLERFKIERLRIKLKKGKEEE